MSGAEVTHLWYFVMARPKITTTNVHLVGSGAAFATFMCFLCVFNPSYRKRPNDWKRPWCWKRLRAGGEGEDRGGDDWMVSLTQWT